MEAGISGLGSPRKATNVWLKSVRINFCRTLKSSLKKKKKEPQPLKGLVKKGAFNYPSTTEIPLHFRLAMTILMQSMLWAKVSRARGNSDLVLKELW